MNKMIKRIVIALTLTVFFIMPAFSESWYLCLGSFKQEKNAIALVNTLEENGIEAVIDNFTKNGELYYRVYIAESYDNRDVARSKIPETENLPIIKKMKITGIWICAGSDKVTPVTEKTAEKSAEPEDVTEALVMEPAVAKSETVAAKTVEPESAETKPAETTAAKKTTETTAEKTTGTTATTTKKTKTTNTADTTAKSTGTANTSKSTKTTKTTGTTTAAKSTKTNKNTKTAKSSETKKAETKTTESKTTEAETKTADTTPVQTEAPVVEEEKTAEPVAEEKPVEEKSTEPEKPAAVENKAEAVENTEETEKTAEASSTAEPEAPVAANNTTEASAADDADETDEKNLVAIAKQIEAEIKASESKTNTSVAASVTPAPVEEVAEENTETAGKTETEADAENSALQETEEEVPEEIKEVEISDAPAEVTEETEKTDGSETGATEVKTEETAVTETATPEITLAFEGTSNNSVKPNYPEDFLVTEEKPYTVYVHTYKNLNEAEYDKKRLESYSVPSFIVKNFDEKSCFNFKLYAGGFEQPEQAEETQGELKLLGVSGTKIADYATVSAEMKAYNDLIINTPVKAYGFEEVKTPDTLSEAVKTVISKVPVNQDYQLEELVVYDLNQLNLNKVSDDYTAALDEIIYQKDKVEAAALGLFEDLLFGNQVTVYVQAGKDFDFESLTNENIRKISIGNDTYKGYISESGGMNCLTAVNEEETLLIKIIGNNLTAPLFNIYITTLFDDNYLYTLPSFRNAICSVPSVSKNEVQRDFVYLVLQRIDAEAAADSGFGDNSEAMENLFWTWGYYNQGGSMVETLALNLDYDYVASKIYETFQDKQLSYSISEQNRPSFVPFVDSWFYRNDETKIQNLNVMLKSYILQLNTDISVLTERNLVDFVEDMQLLSY